MSFSLMDGDWKQLELTKENAAADTKINLHALGTAEVESYPIALASPGKDLQRLSIGYEVRGFLVGDEVGAGGADMTFKEYRCPIVGEDAKDWAFNRDAVAFATATIASSGGTASETDKVTGGDFVAQKTGTAASTTSGSATVALNAVVDLSAVVVGDRIVLRGRTDGIAGQDVYMITAVNDGADTVDVDPIPTSTDASISWDIEKNDWERGNGFKISTLQAEHDDGTGVGILRQAMSSIVQFRHYLLTCDIPVGSAKLKRIRLGDEVFDITSAVDGTGNRFLLRRLAAGTTPVLEFQSDDGEMTLDNVIMLPVYPYRFSFVRKWDEAVGKGAGSGIVFGFLPASDMAGTYLSAWIRRYGMGSY